MRNLVVIAHDMRSTHNVGSLLRTADGMGVKKVFLTGYTPYPGMPDDKRLPYLAAKIDKQIDKTALGAGTMVNWQYEPDIALIIRQVKAEGYAVAALEQAKGSVPLHQWQPPEKVALLLGNEVEGLDPELCALASDVVEIPMFGRKESLNVIQAAAMALYRLRFH